MPWYAYVLLFLLVGFAPFDALYVYIKAQRRRDELKRRQREKEARGGGDDGGEGETRTGGDG